MKTATPKKYITIKQPVLVEVNSETTCKNGWAISFDDMNVMLNKKTIILDKNSKNFMKENYQTVGYYPNLSALIHGMMNKHLLGECSDAKGAIEGLKEIQELMDNFCKDVWKDINSLVQESKKE